MTTAVPDLPAGIRFHPTDEELVVHYLTNQAAGAPCPVPIVAEVNIYACNPWELPARALFGDTEWYFFSPRDRKYPNGARPNRAAGDGYWKATGTDRPVLSSTTNQRVGVKKALVFYSGRSPRGVKTDWIMHEYRLVGTGGANHHHKAAAGTSKRSSSSRGSSSSMRLDDWVLCRIYKKTNDFSSLHLISDQLEQEASSTVEEEDSSSALATNNINTAATLASPSSLKSEAHDHDHHQFLQTRTPTTMSKSCSLTDLLNTIDGSALSQMLLLDGGGGPEEVDAHAEPLIYYPPQGTTAHTHQQSLINNNNNVMNGGGGGGGGSSSSHFISTNNLLPTRAVDACSDNNGLMMKRKRTMTAMDDGAAGSSLDSDDDGISKKLMKLLPSDSRNPVVGSSAAGSYCNQLLVDTNNAAAGFQFQFQPSSSPMMMRSYPFLQMQ